jgi:dTDP-4-dehydrorhamnose reductase
VWTPGSQECDVRSLSHCADAVTRYEPDLVIHAAACANTAVCERNRKYAWSVNVEGAENMARAAAGRRFILISTDYVFDGEACGYAECDVANPVNFYGLTKLAAEIAVRQYPEALIVRAPFRADPPWRYPAAFCDQWTSCRFVSDVAPDILQAALMPELTGPIHIGGPRRAIVELAREASPGVGVISRQDLDVRIPRDTSLDSRKWHSILAASMPSFQPVEIST